MAIFDTVLFDLDDTLYLERDFFIGGFAAVAAELVQRGLDHPRTVSTRLMDLHLADREGVLDRAAELMGFPLGWVPDLVSIFRRHEPDIRLAAEVPAVLLSLREVSIRVGVVTDGPKDVQRRKLASLGVLPLVDAVVVADDLGRTYWKPHPLSLQRCLSELGANAEAAVFVGDNPERDVRGARSAGLVPIRIRRRGGYFSEVPSTEEADHDISDLTELAAILRCP